MNRVDLAASTFDDGFSCSQAILSAFSESYGMDRTIALRVAGAFGGGIAGMALTCGAITGALIVIGLAYGKCTVNDDAAKQKTSEISHEFVRRFVERQGSIACRDLLGVDISTPEGKQRASDEGLSDKLCTRFVRDAAAILEEIL